MAHMISFIIPAYNEELLLGRTLDALHRAARSVDQPYEIIVADDDSSDRTGSVAAEHGAAVVHTANRQIAATRNAGARTAKGDWLFFVDADTLVSDELLTEAVAALADGAAGGGAAFRFDEPVPLYGKILQWVVRPVYRLGKIASGSFIFCTREAFDQVGGFDETLYGSEEAVMSRALGRCGPFVVLRETVLTSGRRLRLNSFWSILGILFYLFLGGGRITNRRAARLWYDGRRETTEENDRPDGS